MGREQRADRPAGRPRQAPGPGCSRGGSDPGPHISRRSSSRGRRCRTGPSERGQGFWRRARSPAGRRGRGGTLRAWPGTPRPWPPAPGSGRGWGWTRSRRSRPRNSSLAKLGLAHSFSLAASATWRACSPLAASRALCWRWDSTVPVVSVINSQASHFARVLFHVGRTPDDLSRERDSARAEPHWPRRRQPPLRGESGPVGHGRGLP